MATFYLVNFITLGTQKVLPGSLIDDQGAIYAPLLAAGGELWPSSDAAVAAAALKAQNAHKNRGANEREMEDIMRSALELADVAPGGAPVPGTRNLVAGAGLTGGGDLTADRTFNVGANADGSILANPDDIQVGVLASDAQHGNRGGGAVHANAVSGGAAGFMTGADKALLNSLVTGIQAAYARIADVAAGTATAEVPFWTNVHVSTRSVIVASISPRTTVAGNDVDNATITIRNRNSDGSLVGTVAALTLNVASGGTVAFNQKTLGAITNAIVAANGMLTVEVTKAGAGMQLGALNVDVRLGQN
ncbi:MAG: hypothetical protein PVSMB8_00420 [Vulcanimicrobiaceae bacterium]